MLLPWSFKQASIVSSNISEINAEVVLAKNLETIWIIDRSFWAACRFGNSRTNMAATEKLRNSNCTMDWSRPTLVWNGPGPHPTETYDAINGHYQSSSKRTDRHTFRHLSELYNRYSKTFVILFIQPKYCQHLWTLERRQRASVYHEYSVDRFGNAHSSKPVDCRIVR